MDNECRNKRKCNINDCGIYHHVSLHVPNVNDTGLVTPGHVNSISEHGITSCLLPIMKIKSGQTPISALWDSGASISLITFKTASQLKLKGKDVNLSVYNIGGEIENILSYKYVLPIMDRNGNVVKITVFGIGKISKSLLPPPPQYCENKPDIPRIAK